MGSNAARSTALFTNTAAMGTEFNQCRETYFSCMDQFCGLANDVYRRCICSNRFREFRDREESFDMAKQLILEFNDNNLNVIGMSAGQVNAMYSASEGESAMRRDTSASAQMLNNINDLLSGKTKASSMSTPKNKPKLDLGLFGSSSPFGGGDIFGGDGGGAFGSNNTPAVNIEMMEGRELYDQVHGQCMQMAETCRANQAVGNMATSAYTVLVTQDCNAYERHLGAQKSALESTIREANNMMMDARLEEFKKNNSADFNQCIEKTRDTVKDPMACGANWERCLDFTGQFVNQLNGEPILTPIFFQLSEQIDLSDHDFPKTKNYLAEIDKYRNRASGALSSCRENSEQVWQQFRQMAMIEIAQAQSRMIEQVKGTCISTMTECYDATSGQLKKFSGTGANDKDTASAVASATGALAHRTTTAMCEDKVLACAALYNTDPKKKCEVDNGRIKNADSCGLASLLAFVNTVDNVKVSLACKSDLESWAKETCEPKAVGSKAQIPTQCVSKDSTSTTCSASELENHRALLANQELAKAMGEFPFGCRNMPLSGAGSFQEGLIRRAMISCLKPDGKFDESAISAIREVFNDVRQSMGSVMSRICAANPNGIWTESIPEDNSETTPIQIDASWAMTSFGGQDRFLSTMPDTVTFTFGGDNADNSKGHAGNMNDKNLASTTEPKHTYEQVSNNDKILMFGADHGKAIGWGICMNPSAAMQCRTLNNIAGQSVATFDRNTGTCNFAADYPRLMCENALYGTWNNQAATCQFVPEQ